MIGLPNVGTRVAVRFRRPPGSDPALSDAVGHLLAVAPRVRVQTKTGDVVEFAADDVVTVRRLTDVPVRNSQIRAVEHAAALGWPGTEHQWLHGWLLRAGGGATRRANSAVPLEFGASFHQVPAIVDWYVARGLTPLFAIPDRLLSLKDETPVACQTRMLVADLPAVTPAQRADPNVTLEQHPGTDWLAGHARGGRAVPAAVLTAVIDGEVRFAHTAGAVGRAAVTGAPDGTRWVGLSEVRAEPGRVEAAAAVCAALLGWAAGHGATRGYVQLPDTGDDAAAEALELLGGLGFTAQHRCRFVHTDAIWSGPTTRRV